MAERDEEDRRRPRYADDDDDDERDQRRRDTEIMTVEDNEAAFILGKGGTTKQKIARVCGADLDLNERENKISIYGTKKQRQLAMDYIGFIMQQRTGSVTIDLDEGRDDITVVKVPEDCVAFVMGRGGQTLRMMESEWGSLMFFAKTTSGRDDGREMLMIFGSLRARRGAEMKVMSAVEHKKPGTFVRGGELFMQRRVRGDESPEGWEVDSLLLDSDEFSYALGAGGSTRKKLATASGCVLEYIGKVACMVGFAKERRRARDYLKWLLRQRHGPVQVDHESRDDVTVVSIPSHSVGYITGHRGEGLRAVERETGTFCFINDASRGGSHEELMIFCSDEGCRRRAKDMVLDRLDDHRSSAGRGGGGYRDSYGDYYGGRDRDYYGGRDRYDDRDYRRGRRDDDDDRRRRDDDDDRRRYDDDDRRRYDDDDRRRYDDDDRRRRYDDDGRDRRRDNRYREDGDDRDHRRGANRRDRCY